MTIPQHLRVLNERFTNLEMCAERAPVRTYQTARDAIDAISEASNALIGALRSRGFRVRNGDHLRAIEAAMYGYLLEGNPDRYGLLVGEGFGDAMNGLAAERVIAQTVRDRDALEAILSRLQPSQKGRDGAV